MKMARPVLNRWRQLHEFEEYLVEVRRLRVQRRVLRDTMNPLEIREEDFRRRFRVSREIAHYLCNELAPHLRRQRSSGLPVHTQVLVALRFFAEGGYQLGVGQDFFLSVSQKSASRCIRAVVDALCDHLRQRWIKFPVNNRDRAKLESRFRRVVGFPRVMGAIDCTHVAIVTPNDHEESYENHKGFYSLNVQMICDNDMRINDVTAYPGTVHDQFIWSYSNARAVMRTAHDMQMGAFYLIGDSGYALEPWLLTPVVNADDGTPEHRYTRAHCHARSVIERTFGVLKARWRCLRRDRVLHYQPAQASRIVIACAILHNIMVRFRMPEPEIVDDDGAELNQEVVVEGEARAQAQRNRAWIINTYFN